MVFFLIFAEVKDSLVISFLSFSNTFKHALGLFQLLIYDAKDSAVLFFLYKLIHTHIGLLKNEEISDGTLRRTLVNDTFCNDTNNLINIYKLNNGWGCGRVRNVCPSFNMHFLILTECTNLLYRFDFLTVG